MHGRIWVISSPKLSIRARTLIPPRLRSNWRLSRPTCPLSVYASNLRSASSPPAGMERRSSSRIAEELVVKRWIALPCAVTSNSLSPLASRRSAIDAAATPRSKARLASSATTLPARI